MTHNHEADILASLLAEIALGQEHYAALGERLESVRATLLATARTGVRVTATGRMALTGEELDRARAVVGDLPGAIDDPRETK